MGNDQLLSQKRAAVALKEIQEINSLVKSDKEKDAFAKLAASAPAMILQNGLGQTLVFCLAKSKQKLDKHHLLFSSLANWLSRDLSSIPQDENKFLEVLNTGLSVEKYLLWQREALAYLEWLKRYAAAFLEKDKVEDLS